jgi:P4 family phage/plasmid primase-like protien
VAITVRRALVDDVLQALKSLSLLRASVLLPSLLPEGVPRNLFALENGLLDLDGDQLLPHTPDWFSTVCLPYRHEPQARGDAWLAVLQRNLEGDAERIALLQEFFGYCLARTTDAQACLILVGEGGNGKSVILAALRAVLGGDNCATVPLEHFGQRFAMAQTLGKLVNICPEVGELDKTAEGTLKGYVSGDPLFFERKGKDGFSAAPSARLVIATNNIPRFADKTEGLWRRLLILPFDVTIPPAERRAGMDKEGYWTASGELPGMLNWALEGLRRLRAHGWRFTIPAACRAAVAEHRLESDPARAFLSERFVADPEAEPAVAGDLYQDYKWYCDANGHRNVMSSVTFGRQVRRVFPNAVTGTRRVDGQVVRVWTGLRQREAVPDDPAVTAEAGVAHAEHVSVSS